MGEENPLPGDRFPDNRGNIRYHWYGWDVESMTMFLHFALGGQRRIEYVAIGVAYEQ